MPLHRVTLPHFAAILGGLLICGMLGCGQTPHKQPAPPPPTMTVAQPIRKEIVEWDAYTGRLEPIEFVEVRARVSGYLQSIHFDEGQVVHEGDLLFIIDPRPFEATLTEAKAQLRQAQSQLSQAKAQMSEAIAQQKQANAQLQLAEVRVQRARRLRESNAVAQDELDQRETDIVQSQADVASAEASIQLAEAAGDTANAAIEAANARIASAQLDLNYTRVYAPVSGRISREYVTEGNLISGGTATSTLLTTITSVEPIYCAFDVNEHQALKYIRLAQQGKRKSSRDAKNPVYLGLSDEKNFPHLGHMEFVDNRFDTNTASMRVRCIFRNEDQVLVPGMFARVRLPGSAAYEAVLIPDSAIGTDQSSQYVYIVEGNKIERRAVVPGPLVDGLRVIREGLTGTEQLVTEGLLLGRPGMEVQTKSGDIQVIEDGLPNTYVPLPPEQWISSGLTSIHNNNQDVPTSANRTEGGQ
ncbi:efflux RND transporter periplasmic adaptor subunit [Bremerella cremea]|uniref:Efflux RND transporter periplasmic adaptor subunit n=1 Tax=Bremerella cremea TaxID=1031537 RepID=A0A368KWR6_9BACT|nr:efflux RND transporter periplasmic adaptor subunit [Bremerella cremea]